MRENNDFSSRLRKMREKEGVSQVMLAQFCGISDCLINKYERGKSKPTAESLAAIADHYHVTMDYLWRGKK